MRNNQAASMSSIGGSPFHQKPKMATPLNKDVIKTKPITSIEDFAQRSKSVIIGRQGSPDGVPKPKKRLRNRL